MPLCKHNILCYASQEINDFSEVGSWRKMKCIVLCYLFGLVYNHPSKAYVWMFPVQAVT